MPLYESACQDCQREDELLNRNDENEPDRIAKE